MPIIHIFLAFVYDIWYSITRIKKLKDALFRCVLSYEKGEVKW